MIRLDDPKCRIQRTQNPTHGSMENAKIFAARTHATAILFARKLQSLRKTLKTTV